MCVRGIDCTSFISTIFLLVWYFLCFYHEAWFRSNVIEFDSDIIIYIVCSKLIQGRKLSDIELAAEDALFFLKYLNYALSLAI